MGNRRASGKKSRKLHSSYNTVRGAIMNHTCVSYEEKCRVYITLPRNLRVEGIYSQIAGRLVNIDLDTTWTKAAAFKFQVVSLCVPGGTDVHHENPNSR